MLHSGLGSATMTFEIKLRNGRVPLASHLQRKAVLSRLQAEAPASLKAMWADFRRHGTGKMTMWQIDTLIAEVRTEQAH